MRAAARRLAALLLTSAVVLLGLMTSPAEAHAYLVSSNPVDGSRLESAPARLELAFSEHVVVGATRISVVDDAGHVARVRGLHLVTRDATDTEEPAKIVGSFDRRLPAAAYRVSWQTLSSDDLHRTAGVFVFGVGRTVTTTAVAEPRPAVDETAARAAFLLGVALILGSLLAERVLRRTGVTFALPRRLAIGGGALALAMSIVLLASQLARGQAGFSSVLFSAYGLRWTVRFVGLLVLIVGVLLERPRWRETMHWLGLALACLGTASLGHAASGTFSPTRLVADAAHIAATLSWGGAVICLALALLSGRAAGLRATLHAFARPAAACLSVAVVTGVYLSSWVVGSVDAAILTFYGRTLLLKLAVVGAAAGLRSGQPPAATARLRRPTSAPHGPRRGVRGRRSRAPDRGPDQLATGHRVGVRPPACATDTAPAVRQLADLEVSASLRPNRPGSAIAVVDVFDTRRPAPAPITGVTVSLPNLAPVQAQPLDDGHWSVPVTASRAGTTSIRVRVHRAGEPDVTGRLPWTVGTGRLPRPATISQAPLRAWLLRAAAALVAALIALWGAGQLTRVRRGRFAPRRELAQPTGVGPAV